MRPIRRFTLATAVVALVLYTSGTVRSDEPAPVLAIIPPAQDGAATPVPAIPPATAAETSSEVIMEIIPAQKLTVEKNVEAGQIIVADPANGVPAAVTFSREEYQRVYNSIPFSRAEYKANPNYRHDTAMEILTGNPRTQTIVNHQHIDRKPVKRVPPPSRPSRPLTPFSGYSYFLGYPWMNFWRY